MIYVIPDMILSSCLNQFRKLFKQTRDKQKRYQQRNVNRQRRSAQCCVCGGFLNGGFLNDSCDFLWLPFKRNLSHGLEQFLNFFFLLFV